MACFNDDRVICRNLQLYGSFEDLGGFADFINSRFPDPLTRKLAVDVGANIGLVTTMFGVAGFQKIISIDALFAKVVKFNVLLNGINDRVMVVDAAVGAQEGTNLTMTLALGNPGGSTAVAVDKIGFHPYTNVTKIVPVVRIEDEIDRLLQNPLHNQNFTIDIMKVDVEGYEWFAFQGLTRLLTEKRIHYLLVEFFVQFFRSAGTDPIAFLQMISGYGCDIFRDAGMVQAVTDYQTFVDQAGGNIYNLFIKCF